MIRMMMYDHQTADSKFQAMMKDFVTTHYNQNVSTEDFKKIVEKHMTNQMNLDGNARMDWFFNEWVYGTEMPSYQFEYHVETTGGKPSVSGRITQSGVSDHFKALVPVYADFGKGWVRLGSANLKGNTSVELKNFQLPYEPKKLAICALDDVLALKIENSKK
jgi:aminopeptidase N